MSDLDVSLAFDALEELLDRTLESPDPEAVARWHEGFRAALASAERGPLWPQLKARGEGLESRLQERVSALRSLQEAVREEMAVQNAGQRALQAYAPARI